MLDAEIAPESTPQHAVAMTSVPAASMAPSIVEQEDAINGYKLAHPVRHGILCHELRLLATLYGQMIYSRSGAVASAALAPEVRVLLAMWTRPADR